MVWEAPHEEGSNVATTAGPLDIEEDTRDGIAVLTVEGELDLSSAPDLCARLTALRGERFVVDLSRVGFCDSSGLRALLGEAHECRIMGGRSVVVTPSRGQVHALFELTGLATMLEVADDVEAAVARLRPAS
jgi:anti-anti-sigma factor